MHSIVLDSLMHVLLSQSVYDLNVFKVNDDSSTCAAGDVCYFISLDCYLHVLEACNDWQLEVITWLGDGVKERSSSEVDANMTFLNDMETIEDYKDERQNDSGECTQ